MEMPYELIGSVPTLLLRSASNLQHRGRVESSILALGGSGEGFAIRRQGHVSMLQVDSQLLSRRLS
jgi:hypothetical protein